ncbi:MAG TPA: hypothetical protein VKZ83_13355 [Phototrophicaceae bacterium]|nr:hypothetical protein [Phototrophicaceae bacterium]
MSIPHDEEHARAVPDGVDEHYSDPVLLEEDETVPPRPEEEIADQLRAEPS